MQKFDFRPLGLALLLLMGTVARAQSPSLIPYSAHPDVPATLEVAGLHLVLDEDARRRVGQLCDQEFALTGHLVADVCVVEFAESVDQPMRLEIEALTVEVQ